MFETFGDPSHGVEGLSSDCELNSVECEKFYILGTQICGRSMAGNLTPKRGRIHGRLEYASHVHEVVEVVEAAKDIIIY